jgi:hypothetical protein
MVMPLILPYFETTKKKIITCALVLLGVIVEEK